LELLLLQKLDNAIRAKMPTIRECMETGAIADNFIAAGLF
jgi:hypothetical protein